MVRSTCPSQNVQSTSASEHFWKLRCRKSARHCGAKHISKSKCTNRPILGPLLEVEMSKKCMPLWHEARFQVKKCTKHTSFGPLLEVEMLKKCTALWPEARFQVKMYETHQLRTTFGRSDVVLHSRRAGFCTWPQVSKTTTLHYSYSYNYTTLRDTTLHCTTLHYTTLITLHYATLHYTPLH